MECQGDALNILQNAQTIEELKTTLLKAQCSLQEGTLYASEEQILESLSQLIGGSYLLARRLGVGFSRLDRVLLNQLAVWEKNDFLTLESHWGDHSLLLDYLAPKEE